MTLNYSPLQNRNLLFIFLMLKTRDKSHFKYLQFMAYSKETMVCQGLGLWPAVPKPLQKEMVERNLIYCSNQEHQRAIQFRCKLIPAALVP